MGWRHETTRRRALGLIAAGTVAGTLTGKGEAQAAVGNEVDLNLVLAVDASGSVNQVRFDLQKQGYVPRFPIARSWWPSAPDRTLPLA